MMRSHIREHAGQGADLDRSMIRDGDVMRSVPRCGQADVGAALPAHFVPQLAQRLDQLLARKVTREPHAAITISFTMCRRITLGI